MPIVLLFIQLRLKYMRAVYDRHAAGTHTPGRLPGARDSTPNY